MKNGSRRGRVSAVGSPNDEVAEVFEELAELSEIAGGDRFRVLAYQRVAATVRSLGRDISKMDEDELKGLRGVGKATARKIIAYLASGEISELEELRESVPEIVIQLKSIRGVGTKKALLIHEELGVETIADFKEALEDGRVRELPGMGSRTEQNLLRSIALMEEGRRRSLLDEALAQARAIQDELDHLEAVERHRVAGSLRRMTETIGDIDILVASDDPEAAMESLTELKAASDVIGSGPTKTSLRTPSGLQVDVRVVAPDEFGAALQYFTGSKEHNVRVREHAVKEGFKLSEYGLFKIEGNERVAAETEDEVYRALGMQTPPPTLRENKGEVERSLEGTLPDLVKLEDIKGDLHSHSFYSDGRVSMKAMAEAARERGYDYLAITDHGERLYGVPRLRAGEISQQRREIDELNDALSGDLTVLHGVELNIAADGSLDYPDETLEDFDVVLASLHQSLDQPSDVITKRVVTALRNPHVDIFAHPTSRRMRRRDPVEGDLEEIFGVASEEGVVLEVNASPSRLDLKDDHVRLALEMDCKIVINTDSHSIEDLDRMELGVAVAQRGWATSSDVLNTLGLDGVRKALRS